MTIYIIGDTSFLAKHFYQKIKHDTNNIYLVSRHSLHHLNDVKSTDTIINFCGVNRGKTLDEYYDGNVLFIKKIVSSMGECSPFFIHISSMMVHGFKNISQNNLPDYQKWFIETRKEGEIYLLNNYNNNNLCIIRPSNICGYDCKPYYNNLVSTLVYEKIHNLSTINKINTNCVRNVLSVEKFTMALLGITNNNTSGVFDIISNNNIPLNKQISTIYIEDVPEFFDMQDGDVSEINMGTNILCISENFTEMVKELEDNMKTYYKIKNTVKYNNLTQLSQPRGNMVEISNVTSRRLYKITLTEHAIRGNHYHFNQTEEFYNNKGIVTYLLGHSENKNVTFMHKSTENDLMEIPPNIIHTVINDYKNNNPEIFITSTQSFVKDEIPDTCYIVLV